MVFVSSFFASGFLFIFFISAACGLSKVDLVIILDASTSVTVQNFKKQLEFVKTIVEYADIDSGRKLYTILTL